MKIKKFIILSFCALFLGAQIFVILYPSGDRLFWPFKKYPMYSRGKKAGDSFQIQEIKVVLKNNKKITLENEDLHIFPYRLNALIHSANKIRDSVYEPTYKDFQNLKYLNYLINKYISPNSKRVEIWEKTFTISQSGVKDLNVKWMLANSWNLTKNKIPNEKISFY